MKKRYSVGLSLSAILLFTACSTNGTPTEESFAEENNTQVVSTTQTEDSNQVDDNIGYLPIYPIEKDEYEGTNGDNNASTAGTITVGEPLQSRSIYPQGDYDWVKVELEQGVVYDIFAYNLNEVGDTYLYLYNDTDQTPGNHIARDDDYIDYDSYIEFNATYTGTYYIKVRSYSVEEATSYQLGVRIHEDQDDDGYSAVYDCNDLNDSIYPFATEIPGDGIDQDCSGVDAIADGTPDQFEVDDDIDSAKSIPKTTGSYWEIEHRIDIFNQMRTIHDIGDTDFMQFTLSPESAAYIIEYARSVSNGLSGYNWYLYDENGSEIQNNSGAGIYQIVENTSSNEQTYYLEIRGNGSDIGWYVPTFVDIGEDRDGDGYYTRDWSGDCNDNDPTINPGADDSNDTDGIDMNCDGVDGYNSNYRS